MKPGLSEIVIIIVIILIIFAVTRMRQVGRNTAQENRTPARAIEQKNEEVSKRARRPRIQILGTIFILVGILILLSNISLARWVALAPIWAIAIAAIGLATIFMARRR